MCFYTPLRAKEMRDLAHPPDKKKEGALIAPLLYDYQVVVIRPPH
jgi:hypothetical protein